MRAAIMAITTPKNSGLTDEELRSLWATVRLKYPDLYKRFVDAEYQATASEDELRANVGGVHQVIQAKFPELETYPGRILIYEDMIRYLPRCG